MVERALELDVRDCNADQLRKSVAGFDSALLQVGFHWSNRSLLDYPLKGGRALPTVFVDEVAYLDSAPDLSGLLVTHGHLEQEDVNSYYASL